MSWRKSTSVNIINEFILPEQYIKQIITTKPMKDEIKAALAKGEAVEGAELVTRNNIQIK